MALSSYSNHLSMNKKLAIGLVIAVGVILAAAGAVVWIGPKVAGRLLGSESSEAAFRRDCFLAAGTVGLRQTGWGDRLVCFSRLRLPDAGRACGRGSGCLGTCYTSEFNAGFAGDIEIGGSPGRCSEHYELGSWSRR